MKKLQRWLGFFLSGLLLSLSLVFGWVEQVYPQSSTDLPSFLYLCENRSTLPQELDRTVEYIIDALYTSSCQDIQSRLPEITSLVLRNRSAKIPYFPDCQQQLPTRRATLWYRELVIVGLCG
jgi:hypothetical protein